MDILSDCHVADVTTRRIIISFKITKAIVVSNESYWLAIGLVLLNQYPKRTEHVFTQIKIDRLLHLLNIKISSSQDKRDLAFTKSRS